MQCPHITVAADFLVVQHVENSINGIRNSVIKGKFELGDKGEFTPWASSDKICWFGGPDWKYFTIQELTGVGPSVTGRWCAFNCFM